MSRDEAEMEYLKIAQDLEMNGVSYFSITVGQHLVIRVGRDWGGMWCQQHAAARKVVSLQSRFCWLLMGGQFV